MLSLQLEYPSARALVKSARGWKRVKVFEGIPRLYRPAAGPSDVSPQRDCSVCTCTENTEQMLDKKLPAHSSDAAFLASLYRAHTDFSALGGQSAVLLFCNVK